MILILKAEKKARVASLLEIVYRHSLVPSLKSKSRKKKKKRKSELSLLTINHVHVTVKGETMLYSWSLPASD